MESSQIKYILKGTSLHLFSLPPSAELTFRSSPIPQLRRRPETHLSQSCREKLCSQRLPHLSRSSVESLDVGRRDHQDQGGLRGLGSLEGRREGEECGLGRRVSFPSRFFLSKRGDVVDLRFCRFLVREGSRRNRDEGSGLLCGSS